MLQLCDHGQVPLPLKPKEFLPFLVPYKVTDDTSVWCQSTLLGYLHRFHPSSY